MSDDTGARWVIDTEDGASCWYAEEASERKLEVPKRLADVQTNEFIASTETEARDGDIIEQSSWRLAEYRRNPVVLDNHYGELVGRSELVRVVDGDLRALIRWDDAPENPRGAQVARFHREKLRQAVSVRWITGTRTARNKLPEDHVHYHKGRQVEGYFGSYLQVGDLLTRCTLLEISSVDVPADPRALQTRFMGAGLVRRLPDQGARDEVRAAVLEALRDPAMAEDDAFRALITDVFVRASRSEAQLRTCIAALAADFSPPEPKTGPTLTDWLRPALERSST